jgi:hypothetical protein
MPGEQHPMLGLRLSQNPLTLGDSSEQHPK